MDPTSSTARVRAHRLWPWLLLALLATLVLALVLFDWNWLRGPLERRIEAATGRDAAVGALNVHWGWPPTVVLDQVTLGNAEWSEHETMAQAERIAFELSLWPLLRGELVLPSLRLRAPELLLERTENGQANWHFGERDADGDGVAVGALRVDGGRLRVLEPGLDTDLSLAVRSAEGEAGRPPSLLLDGEGRYRGRAFSLEGRVDPPLELRGGDQPYQVDLTARAGDTKARAHGALSPPLDLREFTLQFALQGATLAALHPLLGIGMPDTPPYRVEGQLSRVGEVWRYRKFQGRVGDSDLSGRVTLDLAGERPYLEAKLKSDRLDLDDLGPVIGAPPGIGPEETASERQAALAAERARAGKLLPDRPFRLQALRGTDADATLDAAQVVTRKVPVSAMSVRLHLEDGVLTLDPLSFAAAGGRVAGHVRMDAGQDPIAARTELRLRGLQLPRLFKDSELAQRSLGHIAANVQLEGTGNSVAAMLAHAEGYAGAAMGRGRVSNLMLELAGLDIAEALGFLLTEDRTVPVRCAFAEFEVVDGVMHARNMVFDTTDTVIHGDGTIDLRAERMQLELRPRPRDTSLAALRVPLQVSGTLRDPDVAPKGGQLALRALAGVALYALTPPAALLALVETGPGESTDCGQKLDSRTAADGGSD